MTAERDNYRNAYNDGYNEYYGLYVDWKLNSRAPRGELWRETEWTNP